VRAGALLRQLSQTAQAQNARATSLADQSLSNIRTVRAFAAEPLESEYVM
jgi:ABC-type multidrug transport system fused ATPase/permease subunit